MTDRRDDELDEGQTESPVAPARTSPEGVRILGAEEAQAAMDAGTVGRRLGDQDTRYGDVPARPDPAIRPTVRFPRAGGPAGPGRRAPRQRRRRHRRRGSTTSSSAGSRCSTTPAPADEESRPTAMRDEPMDPNSTSGRGADRRPRRCRRRRRRGGRGDRRGVAIGARPRRRGRRLGRKVLVELTDGDAAASPTLPHWSEPPTGEMPLLLPEAEPVDLTGEESLDAYTAAASTAGGPRFLTGVGDWAGEEYESIEALGDDDTNVGALASAPEDDDTAFDREVAARRKIRSRAEPAAAAAPAPPGSVPHPVARPARRRTTRRRGQGARPHHPGDHRRRHRGPRAHLPEARPGRHHGPRHRDRRARVAGAVPGPPEAGLPPRDDPRGARLDRDRADRVQAGRVRVPVHARDRDDLHAALVPVRGREDPPDGQRRGHRDGLRLRRHPRWLRRPAAQLPERRRPHPRRRALRRRLRHRRATSSARSSARPGSRRRSRRTRPSRASSAGWRRRSSSPCSS